jgi:hypothetical protein
MVCLAVHSVPSKNTCVEEQVPVPDQEQLPGDDSVRGYGPSTQIFPGLFTVAMSVEQQRQLETDWHGPEPML